MLKAYQVSPLKYSFKTFLEIIFKKNIDSFFSDFNQCFKVRRRLEWDISTVLTRYITMEAKMIKVCTYKFQNFFNNEHHTLVVYLYDVCSR